MYDKYHIIRRLEVKSYNRGLLQMLVVEFSLQKAREVSVDEAWKAVSGKIEEYFKTFYKKV